MEKQPDLRPWYRRVPHAVTMLFSIIVLMTILTYLLPAGSFERQLIDGRERVVPGTYHAIAGNPLSIMDMFRAFPTGFKTASDIIFIILASGIMFGTLEGTKTVENAVGTMIRRLGLERRYLIVAMTTFIFGGLGIVVGYENNIAMVPIAAVVSLALGGDLILAAGMSVGAMTVGFGLSPINPYTVGVGHQIAEMPMFSGAALRTVLCFSALGLTAAFNVRYYRRLLADPDNGLGQGLDERGLALSQPLDSYQMSRANWAVLAVFLGGIGLILFGIFQYGWHINDILAVFLLITLGSALVARVSPTALSENALRSVALVAPGAFMVGLATTIKVILEEGLIGDSICYFLAEGLNGLPTYASAIGMTLAQSVLNFLIPSGSGQALATLPIMIPLGEILGLTRQTTILAFQIGDGVTNLMNPTLGGLIAMLSLCRVPFDRWLRFILPLLGAIVVLAWAFLLFSVAIEWGPV